MGQAVVMEGSLKFAGIVLNMVMPGIGSLASGRCLQGIVQLGIIVAVAVSYFWGINVPNRLFLTVTIITWIWSILTVAIIPDEPIRAIMSDRKSGRPH